MKTRPLSPRGTLLALCACATLATASRAAAEPATVRFQNRDIATLRATLGPVDAAERADAAATRLERTAPGELRNPVTIIPYGDSRAVALGDRILFVLVPEDVDASAGESVELAAEQAAERLRTALAAWREQRRPEVVARGVIHVLIASAVALVLMFVLRWLRKFVMLRIPTRAEHAMEKRRVTFFGQDLRGFAVKSVRALVQLGTAFVGLLLTYLWLTYCLRQFPLTEPWGDGLAGFFIGTIEMIGVAILHAVPELIVVVLVLLLTRYAVRIVTNLFNAVELGHVTLRGVHPDTADATRRIVTTVIWVFGIAIAYPFIPGSSSDAFKGISVLVGIMLSLGSSGVINQAMSGMVVVFSRALKMGEYVRVGEYEGTVTDVGALSTKIRTLRNEEINIPNATLVSSSTHNYSRLASDHGLIVHSTAGIGYDAPWRVVHRLLVEAALRTPGVRHEPAPFVRQGALTSFAVDYTINAYIERPQDRIPVLSNLHANIQDAFNEAGIQIMTPAFESQPSDPVVVPKNKWGEGEGKNTR